MLFLLLACTTPDEDDGSCEEFPDTPVSAEGSVEASCGYWALAVGDHLYANVFVDDEDAECDVALDEGLSLFGDPIYSLQEDQPRYTVNVLAEAAGTGLLVDVTCDDDTRWQALLDVQ